jgi:hypothetical protein
VHRFGVLTVCRPAAGEELPPALGCLDHVATDVLEELARVL